MGYFPALQLCCMGYSNFPVRWTLRLSPWGIAWTFVLYRQCHRSGPCESIPFVNHPVVAMQYSRKIMGVVCRGNGTLCGSHIGLKYRRKHVVDLYVMGYWFICDHPRYVNLLKLMLRLPNLFLIPSLLLMCVQVCMFIKFYCLMNYLTNLWIKMFSFTKVYGSTNYLTEFCT